MHAVTSMCSSF